MKRAMKERPILFSAPMVRAILDGKKTQTRRPVKVRDVTLQRSLDLFVGKHFGTDAPQEFCPYGQAGDQLWVKETHASIRQEQAGTGGVRWVVNDDNGHAKFCGALYAADGAAKPKGMRWRPSIHMPRCLSRIDLEVTGVRAERLQDITEKDARSEGATPYIYGHGFITESEIAADPGIRSPSMHRAGFEQLWRKIYGDEFRDANPWVWVVEFKRVRL